MEEKPPVGERAGVAGPEVGQVRRGSVGETVPRSRDCTPRTAEGPVELVL